MNVTITEEQYQQIEQAVADALVGKGNSEQPENCYGMRNDVCLVGKPKRPGEMMMFSVFPLLADEKGITGWRLWAYWRDYVVKGNGQQFLRKWSNGVACDSIPPGGMVRSAVDALIENSNDASDNYSDEHLIPVDTKVPA